MDFLTRADASEPYQLDPSGDDQLRRAKRVRRSALRVGGEAQVHEEAERHFGLPASSLHYARTLAEPLYPVTRAASS